MNISKLQALIKDPRMFPVVDSISILNDELELLLLELKEGETGLQDVLEELQFSVELAVSDLYSVYKHGTIAPCLPYTVEAKDDHTL